MAKLTLPDQQAWIDWCRVEDCLRFGITRWGGFMLAALLAGLPSGDASRANSSMKRSRRHSAATNAYGSPAAATR